MTTEVSEVLNYVLGKIKPSEADRVKLLNIYYGIQEKLNQCLRPSLDGKIFEVTLQGSLAKDTFLRNQSDIDIFLLFRYDKDITIEWFEHVLIPTIISCFNNIKYNISYAAHPYLVLYVDNVKVNIVPAFKIETLSNMISAVDRTPFHTEYVKTHLSPSQKDEVRLLKQFLKSWNLYGAEVAVQGFSGYVSELLIIAYKTFYDLLKNAINWVAYRTCIDIEHHYPSPRECIKKFKDNVLVVVDPVDPKRNAAAALSLKKFSLFKLLAKLFIENPSVKFFEEEPKESIDTKSLEIYVDWRLKRYDSCIYIALFDILKIVPDIVWGQLNKIRSAIINIMASHGIDKELYIEAWVDNEFSKAALAIELMGCNRVYKLHTGPYAYDAANAIKFLYKNIESEVGPWIEDDGRLYTIKTIDRDIIAKNIINFISSVPLSGLRFSKLICVTNTNDLISVHPEFLYWFKKFLERSPFKKILDIIKQPR